MNELMKINAKLIVFAFVAMLLLPSCKTKSYKNFTTYFNTYYNAERLMKECESEFEYQSEKKRAVPKIVVPLPQNDVLRKNDFSAPPFLAGLIVDKPTRQTVNVKLDSILIKCSKILANAPKSEYVEPSLYLMAKTYFYKEEWLPSQIKCSELIDKAPTGKYSAEAHLLMALNLLMQGKNQAGLTMLSRTVDVAWLNNEYEILTKAFHIEAEMALFEGDLEGAIRPYFQAIAQSDNDRAKALWQNDLAFILFKMGKFDRAEKAFAKVMNYKPELVTEYESKLYRASSLIRLGRFNEANRILNKLDNDGKFEEWKDYVLTQRLIMTMIQGDKEDIKMSEFKADSLYPTSQVKASYYYERGLQHFYSGDYTEARAAMAKARTSTFTISQPATKMFSLLSSLEGSRTHVNTYLDAITAAQNWSPDNIPVSQENEDKVYDAPYDSLMKIQKEQQIAKQIQNQIAKSEPPTKDNIDTLKLNLANSYFEMARLHYSIGNKDSANYYYKIAADVVPLSLEGSSRYLYVYSESIRDTNVWKADSILNVIVETQPKTVYGKEALARLGYTAAFVTDSAISLYNSGFDLMRAKEYKYAKQQFKKVFEKFPKNAEYASKSLYAVGFMFENDLQQLDSAKHYYNILIEKYPNSEYAKELMLPVMFKNLVDSKSEIPDSLQTKDVTLYEANIMDILNAPYDPNLLSKPEKKDGFSFDDLKNPSKLLEKAKKNLKEKFEHGIDDIKNPEEFLDKERIKLRDEIKNIPNNIKIPKLKDFNPKSEGENNNQEEEKLNDKKEQ